MGAETLLEAKMNVVVGMNRNIQNIKRLLQNLMACSTKMNKRVSFKIRSNTSNVLATRYIKIQKNTWITLKVHLRGLALRASFLTYQINTCSVPSVFL